MQLRRPLLVLGALGASALLVAAACAPADDAPAATTTAPVATAAATAVATVTDPMTEMTSSVSGVPISADAKYGGVLSVATTSWGPTFSHWEEAAGSTPSMGQPLSNMLISKQDWGTKADRTTAAHWNLVPDLGASWEQSTDGLQWTFKLRDGVKFSDGVPFTCDDVKWSFDTIRTGKDLNRSPRAIHMTVISDISCADDLTAVFTLTRPKSSFLEIIGMPYHVVLPEHVYAGNTDLMRDEPNIGTGPFIVSEILPGEKMVFERKADYWDAPFPYLDGIEVSILSNTAQVTALRAGRLDIAGSAGNQSGARADLLIRECGTCEVWNSEVHPGLMFSVIPNFSRAPWNTQEIRDAISYAIDREKEIALGYGGWMSPGTGGLYLPGSYWAMPEEIVKTVPGFDFGDPEGNKEKARALVAQAGYAPGQLEARLVYAPFYAPYVVTVIEDLQAVGINAIGEQQETAAYYTSLSAGEFDLAGHAGWIGGFDPDFILYEYFYSGSDRNYGRYSNPEADRLIDEQSITLDPEARRAKAWEVGEIILRDQVRSLGGYQRDIPILSGRVAGFMPSVSSQSYGNTYRHAHTWIK